MITEEQIVEVKKRIVENFKPIKIIIFGSYAYGDLNEDSNLDILIVKNTDIPRYKRSREPRKALRGLPFPIDIIVYTEKEINEWKNVKHSFIHQLITKGKVIYEQK